MVSPYLAHTHAMFLTSTLGNTFLSVQVSVLLRYAVVYLFRWILNSLKCVCCIISFLFVSFFCQDITLMAQELEKLFLQKVADMPPEVSFVVFSVNLFVLYNCCLVQYFRMLLELVLL